MASVCMLRSDDAPLLVDVLAVATEGEGAANIDKGVSSVATNGERDSSVATDCGHDSRAGTVSEFSTNDIG